MERMEDVTTMAIRLMSSLHHEEELCCKKRKWILRWPEDPTLSIKKRKRRGLGFLTDKYVPTSLTKEAPIAAIKSVIERSFEALQNGTKNPNMGFELNHSSSAKPLPQMPSSPLEAANLSFVLMGKLPIRFLQQINKLLSARVADVPLSFEPVHHAHAFTLNSVTRKVERLLSHVKEGNALPNPLYNALCVVSLSVRVLYGNDGGLRQILGPQNSELEVLEEGFLAAFRHLKELQFTELEKIYIDIGLPERRYQKEHPIMYRTKLRRFLIDSLHCIYSRPLPELVARAVDAINTAREVEQDSGRGSVKQERIRQEFEAVFCLSGQLEMMMWECLEGVTLQNLNASVITINKDPDRTVAGTAREDHGDHLSVDFDNLRNVGAAKCNKTEVESKSFLMDIESSEMREDLIDRPEIVQEVERAADRVATVGYILLGGVLEEFSRKSSGFLNDNVKSYLNMGLEKSHNSEVRRLREGSANNVDASTLVLTVVEKLPGIPKCVFENVKMHLDKIS